MLNPFLTKAAADARIADLHRSAAHFRAGILDDSAPAANGHRHDDETITLRVAGAADDRTLARLADLDSAALPAPPVLLAEVGGEMRAALSLYDASMIANPFHHTAAAQQLLLARAAQLRGKRRLSWQRRLLLRTKAEARAARPGTAMRGAASQSHR